MVTESRAVSVIIPAHNESAGIQRLLRALGGGSAPDLELIVVCNGCTDDTAERAREVGAGIVVLEVPEPSKRAALDAGDQLAVHDHRAWVDADVVLSEGDLKLLVAALRDRVKVAAPVRELVLSHSSRLVRWYYDVWRELPQVRSGVFGRGVVVMSPEGWSRVAALPRVMSDDLAVSEAFAPEERTVVADAVVRITGPGTLADLLRRRVRVATGNAQLDDLGIRGPDARTTPGTLARIGWSRPALLPKVVVFAGVAVAARLQARRRVRSGDFTTWLRDESSRATS
jgi:glycosyltransferase involved in cell wall biosynthesis